MKITNKNFWTILICSILSVGFLVANNWINKIPNDAWRITLLTISSTIATVSLANVLWEVIAKENFAKSVLKQVKISENIAQSGIDAIHVDFRDINWKEEFENTKSFKAAFTYAYSWRSQNDSTIRKFLASNNHRKNSFIIVPNPQNNEIMAEYDRRFCFEKGDTRKKVEDCIKYYYDLKMPIYLFDGSLQSSYYLMDKDGIMSFFTHSKEKTTVPAIRASKNGNMYMYIQADLNSIKQQSHRVTYIEIEISSDGKRSTTLRSD